MHPIRREKIRAAIRDEVIVMIPGDLKDPRVQDVTVTEVKLTEDGENVLIFFTLPVEESLSSRQLDKRKKEVLAGLESASPYIRKQLAQSLQVRKMPNVAFKEDKGQNAGTRVEELLKQIAAERKADETPTE